MSRRHDQPNVATECAANTAEVTHAETPATTPTAKRPPSNGVLAGRVFSRLIAIDEEEQAEIAASPSEIRAKFEQRRARVLAEASDDVRKLVEKMRAT